MDTPASDRFTALPLEGAWNVDRQNLPGALGVSPESPLLARTSFRGIPFDLGPSGTRNAIVLDRDEVSIDLQPFSATYLVFLHAVENRETNYLEGLADHGIDGNELGDSVSEYMLAYADGTSFTKPILRRFGIQQSRIRWGASPFAAVPAASDDVFPTTTDMQILGRVADIPYGRGETRLLRPVDTAGR